MTDEAIKFFISVGTGCLIGLGLSWFLLGHVPDYHSLYTLGLITVCALGYARWKRMI